jgi:hypothetical protein
MATLLDALITVAVIAFIILMAWSRFQNQKMLDTVKEIKQMIKEQNE